jgi:hypothetical protein
MPTSDKTPIIKLNVKNSKRFMNSFRDRIGEGKEFENPSQAFNDMLDHIFIFLDHTKRILDT